MEAAPRRRKILIGNETVITDETETVTVTVTETVTETVTIDETKTVMIAIAETIDMTIGMGTTTLTKSHGNKATAMAYRLAQLTPSGARASIRSDRTIGGTALTAITHVMETEVNTNRCFVTHLFRDIVKVTNVTVGTIDAVTMDDGEMAVYRGPGN